VEDYKENPMLRQETLARCGNDPGSLGNSADCVNVRDAEKSLDVGNLRTLPPLKLPDQKK